MCLRKLVFCQAFLGPTYQLLGLYLLPVDFAALRIMPVLQRRRLCPRRRGCAARHNPSGGQLHRVHVHPDYVSLDSTRILF